MSSPSKIFILQTRQVLRQLTNKSLDNKEKTQAVFNFLKRSKKRTDTLPWLSAEEAWLLPSLDCKAFSVLMLELLKSLKIKSELWIGLNSPEGNGHAWLEVEINGTKNILDRDYQHLVPKEEYQNAHPYSLRTKIAYNNTGRTV